MSLTLEQESQVRESLRKLGVTDIPPMPTKQQPPAEPPGLSEEVSRQVSQRIKGDPTLDPDMSVISPEAQGRLDTIFEALLTMQQGMLREDLLFCYHAIQRLQVENFKLKKRTREFMEYALKTKLLEQRVILR